MYKAYTKLWQSYYNFDKKTILNTFIILIGEIFRNIDRTKQMLSK